MKTTNNGRIGLAFAFVLLASIVSIGQITGVDTSFNAVPGSLPGTGSVQRFVVQSDGKVIAFGPRIIVNGAIAGDIARFNTDGSLDATFNYCSCGITYIADMRLGPDGKLYLAGADVSTGRIIRLNTDGSIDPTFSVSRPGPPPIVGGTEFTLPAIQADGKVFGLSSTSQQGFVSYTLYRYNADGTEDASFPSLVIAGGSPIFATVRIEMLPDGRFFLASTVGNFGSNGTVTRRLANGGPDPTWETPTFTSAGFPSQVNIAEISAAPDGSVMVAGRWANVNGSGRLNVVRLLAAGNVDLTFNSPSALWGTGVKVLPSGKVLYSANVDVAGIHKLFRLNSDGSADGSFTMDPQVSSTGSWAVDDQQRIVHLGTQGSTVKLGRFLQDGGLDSTFVPSISSFGTVNTVLRQADGKFVVAGVYAQVNGVNRAALARVNSDGSIDTSFSVGTGFNAPPENLVQQSDGKILAAGGFSSYNGTAVPGIVRLNTNGSIDNTFAVTTNGSIYNALPQSDGKIYIVGTFGTVNSQTRTGVARVNADGSLDTAFNATIGSPSIRQVLVQSDGKVVIGGSFSGVDGFNRSNFARLNTDGSLDQTFLASVGTVSILTSQADGKFVIGIGTPATSIDRRNSDGSDDTSFVPPTFAAASSSDTLIGAINIRNDGSIVVGGRYNTVGTFSRNNLIRLTSNGSVDLLFPTSGANAYIRSIVSDGADKIVVGGDFSSIFNSPRAGIARLNLASYRAKTNFDFDGDGRADVSVFRASEGRWYILQSADLTLKQVNFAIAGDVPAPADFDGDGKTDIAIYRPSNGDWWSISSATGQQINGSFAQTGGIPVPADISGDGRADYVIYRPATGQWHRVISSNGQTSNRSFGAAGDKPVIGDFNGDGMVDCAIYRPSDGNWWWLSSADGVQRATKWGLADDNAVAADYTGDGRADFGIYRPSTGVWYIYDLANNQSIIYPFGTNGDRPVSADYDGDGRADTSVFRPSNGIWYLLRSTSGYTGYQWGIATDVAVPGAFVQ